MAKTGKELRGQLLSGAARDYKAWQDQRQFWLRLSITCAVLAVFFLGLAVGRAI